MGVSGLLSLTEDRVLATIPTLGRQEEAGERGAQEVTREAAVNRGLLTERPSFTMTEIELGTQKEGPEFCSQEQGLHCAPANGATHKTSTSHSECPRVSHPGLRQHQAELGLGSVGSVWMQLDPHAAVRGSSPALQPAADSDGQSKGGGFGSSD